MIRRLAILVAGVALLAGSLTVASGARFTAATADPTSFSAGTLAAPTGLAATPSGRGVTVAYTPAARATSTRIDVGTPTGSDCSAPTWSTLATVSGLTTSDPASGVPQGTWRCYRATSLAGGFTSLSPSATVAARVGVVVTSVAVTNGGDRSGCPGTLSTLALVDCGDQIVVRFNQPMDPATGPAASAAVCATLGGGLVLTTGSSCLSAGLITLAGSGLTVATSAAAATSWSTDGTTLTYRLTTTPALSLSIAASVSFIAQPSTTTTLLRSAAGSLHVCDTNSGGGDCLPTTAGSF